ncbi:MAG: Uma2 family endonuclease [Moorea sp. SIO4A3]|nr:Uma2 family endonuclease [Moorena sp. SIO4A3]
MKFTHRSTLSVPPLENGDRLTRREFERRYHAMSDRTKAELIEGVVYMASPLRAGHHGRPHALIIGWLATYLAETPGVDLLDNTTVRLDTDNEPQPDALLRWETGGQSIISQDDYVEGAPELIVEIAASTVSIDLNDKLNIYRRNGVREYIVWRVEDGELDWFGLQEGKYLPLEPDAEGLYRSNTFPGLWLDVEALLSGDLAKVFAIVRQGCATR